jgi:hypothetical protein
MSYNINNDSNRSRFKYDFSRDTEVPLYVPIDDSTKLINRHKLNINPKLPVHKAPQRWAIKKHHTEPLKYKKYERKHIEIKRSQPRQFARHQVEETALRKTWGLRHVVHKAPINEASLEFNLHGKNTGDIARSNLLKEGGTLDDLGARIQGHNNGTTLQDAIDSFMSMSKAKQNQNKDVKVGVLSSNSKKLKSISKVIVTPVVPPIVPPIVKRFVKPIVPTVVKSMDSADEKDDEELESKKKKKTAATNIQKVVRGSLNKKAFEKYKPLRDKIRDLRNVAATNIQKVVRGSLSKKDFEVKKPTLVDRRNRVVAEKNTKELSSKFVKSILDDAVANSVKKETKKKDNAGKTIKKAIMNFKNAKAVKNALGDIVDKIEKKERVESTPEGLKTRPRSNTSPKEKSVIDAMAQGSPQYVKKAVEAKEEEIESHIDDPYKSISTKKQSIVDAILSKGKLTDNVQAEEHEKIQKMFPKLKIPTTKWRIRDILKPSLSKKK